MLPDIDSIRIYAAPWMKAEHGRTTFADDLALIHSLREEQFDAAAIFTVFSQSALPAATCCTLAGIPLRAAHCRENPYELLTDWILEREPQEGIRHEVRRQIDFVKTLGSTVHDERLAIQVPPLAMRSVQRMLGEELGLNPAQVLVMHPGATAASRRYPIEQFAEAAQRLIEATGRTVVVTGGRHESHLGEAIVGECRNRAVSLCGRLSLPELAALLRLASLLVANNTGPIHVAAAVGTPVVDLYALTNPQHTPWEVPHRCLSHDVPCRNCFRSVCPEGHNDCLRRVPPAAVVEAALELIEECRSGRVAPTVSVA